MCRERGGIRHSAKNSHRYAMQARLTKNIVKKPLFSPRNMYQARMQQPKATAFTAKHAMFTAVLSLTTKAVMPLITSRNAPAQMYAQP